MNIIISILQVKNLTLSFNNFRVDPGQLTGRAKFKPGLTYLKAKVLQYIERSNNFLTLYAGVPGGREGEKNFSYSTILLTFK